MNKIAYVKSAQITKKGLNTSCKTFKLYYYTEVGVCVCVCNEN